MQDCEIQSRTIRSRLAAADDFFKHAVALRYSLFSAFGNRRFQFQKRRQLFLGSPNEALSVVVGAGENESIPSMRVTAPTVTEPLPWT